MDKDLAEIISVYSLQGALDDRFTTILITHLALTVPSFDGQLLQEALFAAMETFPTPPAPSLEGRKSPEDLALKYWKRKIDAVEYALRNAERIQSAERSS